MINGKIAESSGAVAGMILVVKSSDLYSIFAASKSALQVVCFACSDGVVNDGGVVRIITMFFSACFRKPSKCTSGKAIAFGEMRQSQCPSYYTSINGVLVVQ